ncbi:winged helix-turn-helix domain-containing protein [Kitasatospora sp. NPDC094019]|uniref:winged helix-turn-helix domain-containing protein n=1 Tax=Kitasatospora sp. NPDC094019 TaxID=3364091 RepID=UPI00382B899F
MSSTSTATLPLPSATPHLRAVRSVPSPVDRRHGVPAPQRPAAAGQPGSPPPGSAQSGFGQPGFGPSGPARVTTAPVAPAVSQVVPALPPQALLAALPEGAAVVAALPQGSLPQALLAQYGAQFGAAAGQPMVGYLVLVPAEGGGAVTGAGPQGFPTASIPAPQAGAAVAGGASVLGAPGAGSIGGLGIAGATDAGAAHAGAGAAGAGARPVRPGRGITVDTERRNAYVDGQLLDLTYLEFELLAHLTEHPQRVHTRDHLVSAVWGYGHVGDGRTVDVHVARLRRKLGVAYRDSIVTVRRVGYKYTPAA